MRPYSLSAGAKQDLDDIWSYIARESPNRAVAVLDTLENAIVSIAKSPGIGHTREDLADTRHRFFPVFSYLIVYRYEGRRVYIVRILHGARDLSMLLGDDPYLN